MGVVVISLKRSKGFYEGKIAKQIVYAIQNSPIKKGVLNLNDLKNARDMGLILLMACFPRLYLYEYIHTDWLSF